MTIVQTPSATSTSIAMSDRPHAAAARTDQIARDDHPMDLGRTFADPLDPQLPIPALERQLLRHAHSAEDLDAAVDDATRGLRAEHFAHRCLVFHVAAEVRLPRGVVDAQT